MKGQKKKLPTSAELEILEVLWELKKATVREVHDAISARKKCVYTSTLKTMQKMTTKKLIGRIAGSPGHVFYPLAKEEEVRNHTVKELINKFFNGSYSSLALHALGNSSNDENMEELIKVVNQLKNNKK
ncbi:BlaI/MecI/CopY family transcriptional regulator [Longitalea luteola]|uniref:BlaI/MecI/CopY family transcriptional regulator n=1 Tax=Longitalea luteola TaxID=2812563 RepID=UPI001A9699B8|nr:BlaI/MecI/CopY family transcriptional regulator [Longitalea luteola]